MTYRAIVLRTGYSRRDILVDAESPEAAREIALEVAGNYEFSEHDSFYEVDELPVKA